MLTKMDAIRRVSDLAHAKLPEELYGRLERGTALVVNGLIEPEGDGYRVLNSAGTSSYHVNGACECTDYAKAPEGLCKHRLGIMMLRRVDQLLQEDAAHEALALGPLADERDPAQAPGLEKAAVSVPAQYVVTIQGRPYIKFAGLLKMAHEQNLVELQEHFTYNDNELSLAHAVAIFEDGRRFEGSGDATPQNVTKKVAPHFRRVALTRAKSRALRDALAIDMVAVEELGELE